MGYSLLGVHANSTVGGLPELLKQWKPPLVVALDHSDVWHSVKAESPNTVFVGRIYLESEPDFNNPALDPLRAARDHCDKILPWAERMGQTYTFWQGVNEPIIQSSAAMQRCAAFDAERARLMAAEGFRVVVGSFSVGNPDPRYWADFLPAMEAALQYNGALALHEYAWPTLDHDSTWFILRHRKVYGGAPNYGWSGLPAHLKAVPLLITECGLDGLIELGHPPRGWKALYGSDPGQYLQQLAWFDAELKKDAYVAGAAIYCAAPPDFQWSSYDIWPGLAQSLAQQATPLYRLGSTQPTQPTQPVEPVEPPTPPTPPASGWQMAVEVRPGSRIIAGSLPQAGIQLTITDPWGNASTVASGSKTGYGPGGFEVLAPHEVVYTLSFLGQTFQVQAHDGATLVTFSQVQPPEQPPEKPPAEPPQEPPTEPIDERAKLEQALARLDRIIRQLGQQL
jgi:hypothetical protein